MQPELGAPIATYAREENVHKQVTCHCQFSSRWKHLSFAKSTNCSNLVISYLLCFESVLLYIVWQSVWESVLSMVNEDGIKGNKSYYPLDAALYGNLFWDIPKVKRYVYWIETLGYRRWGYSWAAAGMLAYMIFDYIDIHQT